MPTLHPCDPVGLDFLETAPHRFSNTVDLAITPKQLFEVFEDADAWPHWVRVINQVTWTSPKPRGVGTTRTVAMHAGLTVDEEFLAWEEGRPMSFRFNATTRKPIRGFLEDYRVEPTPGGCRLTWAIALDAGGPLGVMSPVVLPLVRLTFASFLKKLGRYTDERYGPVRDGSAS